MKNLLVAALLSLTAFQGLQAQQLATDNAKNEKTETQSSIKKLTTAEIDRLLDTHKNVFIVDVRKPEEIVQFGSLKGYVNIPIDQLEQRLSEIPKDHLIVALSNHAGRGSKAGELLEKHGYKVAGAAGIQTYTADGGSKYLVHAETATK